MENEEKTKLFNQYVMPHYRLVTWCVDKYYRFDDRATSDRRDDMIQECLINILNNMHLFPVDRTDGYQSWICKVCQNYIYGNYQRINNNTGVTYGRSKPEDMGDLNSYECIGEFDIFNIIGSTLTDVTAYNVPEDEFLHHCNDEINEAVKGLSEVNRRLFMGIIQGYSLEEIGNQLHGEGKLINTSRDNLILQYWFAIKHLRNKLQK